MISLAPYLISLLVATLSVSAALYPTEPVASTILVGGHQAQIVWREDGKVPALSKIGALELQLQTANGVSSHDHLYVLLGLESGQRRVM